MGKHQTPLWCDRYRLLEWFATPAYADACLVLERLWNLFKEGSQTNQVVRLSLITIVFTLIVAIAGCSTTPQYQYNQTERYSYEGVTVDNDAIAYNNQGLAKQNLENYEGAIADYNKALEIDPDAAYAYDSRGDVKKESGDYQGAMTDYNKALEIDPDHDDASDNRERLLKKL